MILPVLLSAGLARLVDPFVGTSGAGATYPAAQAPFGMIQLGPDTRTGQGGANYDRTDATIRDFSLTHLSGVGLPAAGDLPFIPLAAAPKGVPTGLRPSRFKDESASPGRYGVTLTDSGIRVDLAVTTRAGVVRLAYLKGADATVVFDPRLAAKGVDASHVAVVGNEVRGWARGGGFTNKERYTIYFCARFDRPVRHTEEWSAPANLPDARAEGSTVSFGDLGGKPLTMRIALSFVGEDAARANLDAEASRLSLEEAGRRTEVAWDRLLSRIEVEGGTLEKKRMLYTALYHSCLQAGVFSDADGRYIGFDDEVRRMPKGHVKYATFSLWDTYRTQPQLLALIAPEVASDMARSLLIDAQDSPGRGLQSWGYYNDDTACMGTYPAPIFVANAFAFGARDFDTKAMAQKFVACATSTDPLLRASSPEVGGQGWWRLDDYVAKGYVESVSENLEYAQTDMAISAFLRALGDSRADAFLRRSQNVFNLVNPAHGWMQRRDAKGAWVEPFAITDDKGFTEGDSAQYSWGAPHNVARLIGLMGGEKAFVARLDEHLREYARTDAGWEGLTRSPHWWAGNEPGFGVPFLYHWAHRPDRTQDAVDRALATGWALKPDGLPGNDDTGAMSAWYVWAALGLYPEIPGVGGLVLFAPGFDAVTFHLARGKRLRITTKGKGYVLGATRDGKPFTRSWLEDPAKGGEVVLTLAAKPGTWGTRPGDEPPSFAPKG